MRLEMKDLAYAIQDILDKTPEYPHSGDVVWKYFVDDFYLGELKLKPEDQKNIKFKVFIGDTCFPINTFFSRNDWDILPDLICKLWNFKKRELFRRAYEYRTILCFFNRHRFETICKKLGFKKNPLLLAALENLDDDNHFSRNWIRIKGGPVEVSKMLKKEKNEIRRKMKENGENEWPGKKKHLRKRKMIFEKDPNVRRKDWIEKYERFSNA